MSTQTKVTRSDTFTIGWIVLLSIAEIGDSGIRASQPPCSFSIYRRHTCVLHSEFG
jgi:hypothetical protein